MNKIILYLFLSGREHFFRILNKKTYLKLEKKKIGQKKQFSAFGKNFLKQYKKISDYDISDFVVHHWKKYNDTIGKSLLPLPPFSFLRMPEIMYTMFNTQGGKLMKKQLQYLEKRYSFSKLYNLLEEDIVGEPLIMNSKYLTSHNTIDHLYHVEQFVNKTNIKLNKINSAVEWGGGYGNMAKLFRKLKKDLTYTIIDTPLFSMLQWLYLSTIFGEKIVHLIDSTKERIHKGKINILPLSFMKNVPLTADLFVSTWALSESSKQSQDYVTDHQWFNAKHLFLAYSKSNKILPFASRVGELAKKRKAKIISISLRPGHHYAFV